MYSALSFFENAEDSIISTFNVLEERIQQTSINYRMLSHFNSTTIRAAMR